MRFLVSMLLVLALVPLAAAKAVPDQHVHVSTSDMLPATAAEVTVDAGVETPDVDPSRCNRGMEVDSASCQQAVARTPSARLDADADVPLLDLLRKQGARDDAARAFATQGIAASDALAGNAIYLATATAALAGLGFVAWLASRVLKYGLLGFVPMYTHIRDGDLLKDANRARIFDLIKNEPGISTKDVADRLGLAWGTVTHHLGKLEKRHFVVSKKYGKYRRYFANGAAADQVKKDTLAILKVPATAEVATAIRDHPGLSQKEVSEALGVSSSTILWHVKRLEKVSLVQKVRDGKQVRYYPGSTLAQDWAPVHDLVTLRA